MAVTIAVLGKDEVLYKLKGRFNLIKKNTQAGMLAAGLKVQRLSQQRVPVDTGNLRASAYTQKSPDAQLAVEVGYTATYAVFVHENMEQKLKGKPRASGRGVYWGPHGQPKFLESALIDLKGEIARTIAEYAGRGE
jgi:hypothetical protein